MTQSPSASAASQNPALQKYLEQIRNLTILPPVLLNVLQLKDDNELPFAKLEQMVESDQILVTRLIRLANSPFYARGQRPVQNVLQIITRLGFKTVRSMVALSFVDSIFSNGNYAKFRKEVWEHSIATGIYAQFLAEDLGRTRQHDIALLAGLLQDLGKITLNTIDRKLYIETLTEYLEALGRGEDIDIRSLEAKKFGVDNVEMGAAAARLWQLPEEIVRVIESKDQAVAEQSITSQIIGFAGLLARRAAFGKWRPGLQTRFEEYQQILGIEGERLEKLEEAYLKRLHNHELYKFTVTL